MVASWWQTKDGCVTTPLCSAAFQGPLQNACKSDKPSIIIIIITERPSIKAAKGPPSLFDFEKAFDRVDMSLIWLRLEERGINGKCLNAIKAMYDMVTQKVKVGSILGEGFDTYYRVKQGDRQRFALRIWPGTIQVSRSR